MLPEQASLAAGTITSDRALEELASDWHTLWARCPDATPFQSPEWLLPWWRTFGSGELRVFVLRRARELAGIVPLYVAASGDSGERVMRLLGSGNSDYLDALFEPGLEDVGTGLLFRELDRQRAAWDRMDLLELRPCSPLLRTASPSGWDHEIASASLCAEVPLEAGRPEANVPRAFLQKLRYYARLAGRSGGARFARADEATFADAFAALVRLHGARWAARGEPGVLADPAVRSFHRDAARGLLRRGVLRLYTLYVGGEAAASTYGFLHRQRAYFYLTGFDPAFRHLSAGHLVIHHALSEAACEGARVFDLLRGEETYKRRWQPVQCENRRRTLRHRRPARDAQRRRSAEATVTP